MAPSRRYSEPGKGSSGEAILRARLRAMVREQPWAAVAAAAAMGGLVGGLLMARTGRLLFAATVGFVAHELWQREGRLALMDALSGRPREGRAGRAGGER